MGSYYPETVVFVLDACEDPGMEPSKHASRLELLKQSIGMFAQAKSRVNSGHKYGLAVIRDTVQWEGAGVSASPEGLISSLRGVQPFSCGAAAPAGAGPAPPPPAPPPPLDLGAVVALVHPLAVAEEADGGKVRVVLVYGRSTVVPVWTTRDRPGEELSMDVLFCHDKAAAAAAAEAAGPQGWASPQDVYSWLEENVDILSGRCGHSSYIFEAGSLFVKKVPNLMVTLVAHPSQRPPQRALRTAPLDLAAMPPQPTSATPSTFTSPSAAPPAAAPPIDTSAFPPLSGPVLQATAAAPAPAAPGSAWSTPRATHDPNGAQTLTGTPGGAAAASRSAATSFSGVGQVPVVYGSPGAVPVVAAAPAPAPLPVWQHSPSPSLPAGPPTANLIDMTDSPPPAPPPAAAAPISTAGPAPTPATLSWPPQPPAHAAAQVPAAVGVPVHAAAIPATLPYMAPTSGSLPGPPVVATGVPGAPSSASDAAALAFAGLALGPVGLPPAQPPAGGATTGNWPVPPADAAASTGAAPPFPYGAGAVPQPSYMPPSVYGVPPPQAQPVWPMPPPPPPAAAPSSGTFPGGADPRV